MDKQANRIWRDRLTNRQPFKETKMVTDRQKGKYKYGGQADRIMNRQICRQNYGETCKHTLSKKQKQAHKQTNRQ